MGARLYQVKKTTGLAENNVEKYGVFGTSANYEDTRQ